MCRIVGPYWWVGAAGLSPTRIAEVLMRGAGDEVQPD